MSCDCENKKFGRDIERIRRLAKAYAQMEDATVAIFKKPDGTYGFCREDEISDKPIIEYITQY